MKCTRQVGHCGSKYPIGQRTRVHQRRLRLEPLEDRRMLTAYVVDSVDDAWYSTPAEYPTDSGVTLREALEAANLNAIVGDAAAGSPIETDTITFDPAVFGTGATINLAGHQLEITDNVTIDGPGAESLIIDAQEQSRVFEIRSEEWAPLISKESTWSYLDQISNGLDGSPVEGYPLDADQNAWNSPEFNTTTSDLTIGAWQTGSGIFGAGTLEIDPAAPATALDGIDDATNGTDNAVTTYLFRRTFEVTDPAEIRRLKVSILSDDGGILYINGITALPVLMPDGPITTETFSAGVGNEYEYVNYFINAEGLLAEGTNTIAYELHQWSLDHRSSRDVFRPRR